MAEGYLIGDVVSDTTKIREPRGYILPSDRVISPGTTAFEASQRDGLKSPFLDPIDIIANKLVGQVALSLTDVVLAAMGSSIKITKQRVTDPRDDYNRRDPEFRRREQIAIDRTEHRERMEKITGTKVMDA